MFQKYFYLVFTLLFFSSCSVTINSRQVNDDLYYSKSENEKIVKIDDSLLNELDSVVDYSRNPYNEVLIDSYDEARQKRLDAVYSHSFRLNYYKNTDWFYASAYDPMFYNIIVVGGQVWVEPKWLTIQFGLGYRYNNYNSNWYYNDFYNDPYYNHFRYFGYHSYYNRFYHRYYNFYNYSYNNTHTNRISRKNTIDNGSYRKPTIRHNDNVRIRSRKTTKEQQYIKRNINTEKTRYDERKNNIRRSTYKNVKPAVRKRYINSNNNQSLNRKSLNTTRNRNTTSGTNNRGSSLRKGSISKGSSGGSGSRKRK